MKRLTAMILCIAILICPIVSTANEADQYTFYIENKQVVFEKNPVWYFEDTTSDQPFCNSVPAPALSCMIPFFDLLGCLGLDYSGDIKKENLLLTDARGNEYICYLEKTEVPEDKQMYIFIEYGYNEQNLYFGFQMPMSPWHNAGITEWHGDILYISLQSVEYFVRGLGRKVKRNEEERTIHIFEQGTHTPVVHETVDGVIPEEQEDAYFEIRDTLLWNLLVKNFPKATMFDILDARTKNPDNLYGMIQQLEKFR